MELVGQEFSVCQLKYRLASSCIHPGLEGFCFCNKLPRTLMYNHAAIIWDLRPREHSSLVERIIAKKKKKKNGSGFSRVRLPAVRTS